MPLLRHAGQQVPVSKLCVALTLLMLTLTWCVVDNWNHQVSSQLFGVEQVKNLHVNNGTGDLEADVEKFNFPLALAFAQFTFMGVLFLILWCLAVPDAVSSVSKIPYSGKHLSGLVLTHVFSTFWLQSLMMPKQMMSLGVFAASRAVEVPAAATMRWRAMGTPYGGHSPHTSILMFIGASLLYYSYTKIEECLCVWSGFGVSLNGPALYIIYVMLLIVPAANSVFQEATMVHLQVHPLLVLAIQNLGAALVFLPVLLFAHFSGWENFAKAVTMTIGNQEVYMLIIWLCVQMAAISAVGICLIYMVDSFWAVALRSMKVVFWWASQLILFYFFSDTLLSIARPDASLWAFVMLCAIGVGVVAVFIDQRSVEEIGDKPAIYGAKAV